MSKIFLYFLISIGNKVSISSRVTQLSLALDMPHGMAYLLVTIFDYLLIYYSWVIVKYFVKTIITFGYKLFKKYLAKNKNPMEEESKKFLELNKF